MEYPLRHAPNVDNFFLHPHLHPACRVVYEGCDVEPDTYRHRGSMKELKQRWEKGDMTAYMEHKDLTNTSVGDDRARQIADGVHRVIDRVATAESQAGRDAGSVTVLAATKTRDVGEILAAIDAGVRVIGENRPQEVQAKAAGLAAALAERGLTLGVQERRAAPDVMFHLIGQLQSNKIGKVMPVVNTIESVDSLELAEKLARRALAADTVIDVMLEVNESGESTKSGCPPSHAIDIAQRIGAMGGLHLCGLMTVGARTSDERVVREGYAHLRDVRDHILASGAEGTAQCTELSMGMSGDMELAITEGATIVRIGSAIFGERAFK